jgi:hypothetical protein
LLIDHVDDAIVVQVTLQRPNRDGGVADLADVYRGAQQVGQGRLICLVVQQGHGAVVEGGSQDQARAWPHVNVGQDTGVRGAGLRACRATGELDVVLEALGEAGGMTAGTAQERSFLHGDLDEAAAIEEGEAECTYSLARGDGRYFFGDGQFRTAQEQAGCWRLLEEGGLWDSPHMLAGA